MPNRRLLREKIADRHNRARATLLKLPNEILNIIYALVLGGDTIHVFVKENSKVETRRCQAPDADADAVSTICNATERTEIVNYSLRHVACVHHEPFWYSGVLQFFRAHKRFYKDTKALPFALNTFIFSSSSDFTKFKKLLTPFQRDNLVSIAVNCDHLPYATKTLTPPRPMPGLKHLTIFYEAAEKYNPNAPLHIYVQAARRRLSKLLEEFHGGEIKNVEVCVTTWKKDEPIADPQLFGPICAALKAQVLAANSIA